MKFQFYGEENKGKERRGTRRWVADLRALAGKAFSKKIGGIGRFGQLIFTH